MNVVIETADGQRIIFGKEDVFWQSMEGRSLCVTYEDFAKILSEYREKVMGKGRWPGVADPYREVGMDQPGLTKSLKRKVQSQDIKARLRPEANRVADGGRGE